MTCFNLKTERVCPGVVVVVVGFTTKPALLKDEGQRKHTSQM